MVESHGRSLNFNLLTILAVFVIISTIGLLSIENAYAVPSYSYAKSIQNYNTLGAFMSQPKGIARDSSGNLYVADSGNNRIQEYTGTGTFIREFGTPGSAPGQLNTPGGIALDSSGNVYVADQNNNRIQEWSSTGIFLRTLGAGQLNSPYGIFVNSTGYIYVSNGNSVAILDNTGALVKQFNHPIHFGGTIPTGFNFASGITSDTSGNIIVIDSFHAAVIKFDKGGDYLSYFGGSTGSGPNQMSNPRGVSVTSYGNILVADQGNNRIKEFSPSSFTNTAPPAPAVPLATYATLGSGNGQSRFPTFFAIDPTASTASTTSFYFSDNKNDRIQKLDTSLPSPNYVSQFGKFASTTFNTPYGVRVDSSGNLYVADASNDYVSKFDIAGNFVTGIGFSGSGDGQLGFPNDVAFDASGNILVADNANNRIEKFDPTGIYLSQFGTVGTGLGQFSSPSGITTDSSGNIYVVDQGNGRIQKFDSTGSNPTLFASGLSTDITYPSYAAINSTGYLFVTDTANNQIKYYNSAGVLQGSFGSLGSGNGQFTSPSGITIDGSGNILVSDLGNNRIQVFDSHTNYLTQFGTFGSGPNQFNTPVGISLDSSGNVYVGDSSNNRIEIFSPSLPTTASITISPLSFPTARWGVDTVTVSGTVVDPAISGDTVTVAWGDGNISTGIPITTSGTSGTWTASYQYRSTSVGPSSISATLVNGLITKASSNTVSISITAHHTSLTLSFSPSVSSLPWGAPISVTGKLTDTDAANVGIQSHPITFTGSGVGTITTTNTASDGSFTASGNASSTVSSNLVIQAQSLTSNAYLTSSSNSITYATLQHNTKLILDAIPNVLPGAPISVTGILEDTDATPVPNTGIPSKAIQFTLTGSGLLGTITSPSTTDTNGAFTASGNAPSSVTSVNVQAQFAGDPNYVSSSDTQTYSTIAQSISFTPSSSSAIWGVQVNLQGTVQNPATGDTVTVDWGDGSPLNTGILITNTGTWTATYTYPSSAVGTHNIVATLVNGVTKATSNQQISITAHHTSLTLSFSPSVSSLPWGAPISVIGTLTDTDAANVGIPSQSITFTGSGVGTITTIPTNTASDGSFTASGNAPGIASVPPVPPTPGLQVQAQAQFGTNAPYLSSNIPSVTYTTLRHNTSLLLNPISNTTSGSALVATGTLTDTDASNVGVSGEQITYLPTSSIFNDASTITQSGSAAGAFTSGVTAPTTSSTIVLQAQAISAANTYYGPSSSQTRTFSIFPTGGAPTITIASPFNGQTINNTSITISGTASDSSSGVANVQVKIDTGSYQLATGTTSWSITTTVTPGSHTITAQVTNNGGTTATSSVSVISRTLSPPVITTPSSTTNNPVQTISGTADSNVPIKIYDGTTLIGTTVSDSTGHWSLHVTLASGTNIISAKEVTTDATSSSSNTITITVDTVPPTVAISFPLNNAILHTLTLSITGTASDSSSGVANVQVKIDTGSYQLATGTTSWNITSTLTPGPHTITAKATDNAGNISTKSVSINIISTEGKITGGGKISKDTNFGFNVNSEDKGIKGELEFQDKSQKIDLHSTSITFLSINPSGTNGNFLGNAQVNDKNGYTFSVYVEDNGEPGKHDVFGITIFDSTGAPIYSNTGVLTDGNIQIHKSGTDNDVNQQWTQWKWPKWPWNHDNGDDGHGNNSNGKKS